MSSAVIGTALLGENPKGARARFGARENVEVETALRR